jgi:hypothetical protein
MKKREEEEAKYKRYYKGEVLLAYSNLSSWNQAVERLNKHRPKTARVKKVKIS